MQAVPEKSGRFRLDGRSAIVTGGASGIGFAIASEFAHAGAIVHIVDLTLDNANEAAQRILEAGGAAKGHGCNVADQAEVDRVFGELLAGQRIDILVNNAGIAGANLPTWEYPAEEWARVIAINLTGPFNCCKAVVPAMIAQNYGRIVNIASIAGKEGNPNACAYSASKAGVIALTKSLGKELAGRDISVNCVTPAAAKTAIFDQMTREHIDYMLAKIPRGRFVLVEEIADLVAFCASQECSFTTGAVFDISGGRATY
jgi:2-dehydro-3-deoxy-L-rhamnonate dehydrogenase (NAD+)